MNDGRDGVTRAMENAAGVHVCLKADSGQKVYWQQIALTLEWAFRDPAFRAAVVRDVVETKAADHDGHVKVRVEVGFRFIKVAFLLAALTGDGEASNG